MNRTADSERRAHRADDAIWDSMAGEWGVWYETGPGGIAVRCFLNGRLLRRVLIARQRWQQAA